MLRGERGEMNLVSLLRASLCRHSTLLRRVSAAAVDAMLARMADALLAIGFLPADNPDHIMFALRAILGRSGVTPRECDILNGIASQIQWFASGGHETIASKRRSGKKVR